MDYLTDFINDTNAKYEVLAKEFNFNFDDSGTAMLIVSLIENCYNKQEVLEIVSYMLGKLNLKDKEQVFN